MSGKEIADTKLTPVTSFLVKESAPCFRLAIEKLCVEEDAAFITFARLTASALLFPSWIKSWPDRHHTSLSLPDIRKIQKYSLSVSQMTHCYNYEMFIHNEGMANNLLSGKSLHWIMDLFLFF
jgi:hypothetical protein